MRSISINTVVILLMRYQSPLTATNLPTQIECMDMTREAVAHQDHITAMQEQGHPDVVKHCGLVYLWTDM